MTTNQKPSVPKVAVGYCRCSTDEQGATSIPQQKEEVERWAEANDFKIVEWFTDEGRTGTNFLGRPSFANLIKRVEDGPDFNHVIVYDESRWGRALNPRENAYWKVHFERYGVKVRVMHSGSKNGDDIGSYVVEVVESAEASEYSKKLSRAIRRGMMSSQQGIYSRGGPAPYGYKRIAIDLKTGEKRSMRDGMRSVPKQEKVVWELAGEAEVATVRRIFERRAEGAGYVGIADMLNAEGIPCPKPGRWRNKDNKWTGVSVYGVLRNPAYVGHRVYNRLCLSKIMAKEKGIEMVSKWYNDQSEWIVIPDAHPAIVSEELFRKANVQKEPRPTKPNQFYYRGTYLLTGLVKCVHCGYNFQGYFHTSTGNRYYIDGGYVNKGKSVCKWFSIKQQMLEDFVLTGIRDSFCGTGLADRTHEYVEELNRHRPTAVEKRLESISEILNENTEKISNLVSLVESGSELKSISARIKELEDIQEKLEEERRRLGRIRPPTLDPDRITGAITQFYANFERSFDQLTIPERKEMLRRMVEGILVDREERKVHCYLRRLPIIANITDNIDSYFLDQGLSGVALVAPHRSPSKHSAKFQGAACSPNGFRTRILALRGPRPSL